MQIERLHLTLKLMRSLKPGEACRYCDTEVVGLQVWVGTRSVAYYLRKRKDGREYTLKLGNWPDITLEEARTKALDRLGALANHNDIEAPTGRIEPLVSDAVENYLAMQTNRQRYVNAKTQLSHFSHLFERRVCDIQYDDILEVHRRMSETPVMANMSVKRFVAALHYICKRLHKPFANPAEGFRFYEQTPRKRYITKDEAPRFFDALEKMRNEYVDAMMVDVIYMLLYTGARKSNVCEMMLEEIDENSVWTIPKSKFKGKREHRIQLGDFEVGIVGRWKIGRVSGYVFPHKCDLQHRLRKALLTACGIAGMTDFHVHDLRRTLGTWMLSNGTPIAVVSKKLGHSSIGITEQVYAHLMPDVGRDASEKAIDAMRKLN